MFGEDLHVQVPVSYWVRAHKKLVGRFKVSGSCGLDEPPRAAMLHVAVHLRLTPDWPLVARSAVLPLRYLNPCQMTMARLDVTPLLDRYVRAKLVQVVRGAVDAEIPHPVDLKFGVAPVWTRLNRPLSLGEDSWLLLRPQGVRVAPVLGSGPQVSIIVGLVVRTRIGLDKPPMVSVPPLPRLEAGLPGAQGSICLSRWSLAIAMLPTNSPCIWKAGRFGSVPTHSSSVNRGCAHRVSGSC